jgi:hypothetical protein
MSKLFNFLKKAFNQMALLVKPLVARPWVFSIGFGRDVIVCLLVSNILSNICSSVSSVCLYYTVFYHYMR